jgi:hypothetical protein
LSATTGYFVARFLPRLINSQETNLAFNSYSGNNPQNQTNRFLLNTYRRETGSNLAIDAGFP